MKLLDFINNLPGSGYAFIHIGKTAGNTVRAVANEVNNVNRKKIKIYPHECNIQNIMRYRRIKISFILRDPAERFISGFYSRMRNGRPHNNRIWSPREAVAFTYFPNANSFCEALGGEDERLYSAALYSVNSIQHLRRTYSYYFQSVDFIRNYNKRIYAVIDFGNLNEQMHRIFEPFGVKKDFVDVHIQKLHVAPISTASRISSLSDKARNNLKLFLKNDYEIYNYLKNEYIDCNQ